MTFKYFMRMRPEAEVSGGGDESTEKTLIEPTPQFNGTAESKNETPASQEPTKPLYKGLGGEFATTDDLIKYVGDLEARAAQEIIAKQRPATQQNSAAQELNPVATNVEIDPTELFENPAGVIEKITKKIKAELKSEDEAKTRTNTFWEGFYLENPELKNYDRSVKSVMNEQWSYLNNLPLSKAKEILATEARKFINEVRGPEGQRVTMTGSAGGTIPNSFANQGGAKVIVKKPSNFFDEMRNANKRKKT